MRRLSLASRGGALIAAFLLCSPAWSNDFGLAVAVEATGAEGLQAGRAISLDVSITDPATGQPKQGLRPVVWLRGLNDRSGTCSEAARQFWATGEFLPPGSIGTQGGLWVVTIDAQGRASVHDPALNLATANMLAVRSFPEIPADAKLAVDRQELWATLPLKGALAVMRLPEGEPKLVAEGLHAPTDITVSKQGLWVGEGVGGTVAQVSFEGSILQRHAVGQGKVTLSAFRQRVLAQAADGAAVVVESDAGSVLARYAAGSLSPGARLFRGGVADLTVNPPSLRMRYDGRPDTATRIALPVAADGVEISPDGLYAILWANRENGSTVSVVDVPAGAIIHSSEAQDQVTSIEYSAKAAFVAFRENPRIAVIDMAPVASGRGAPVVRDVNLPNDPGLSSRVLPPKPAAFSYHNGVLAARAGSRTLAIVMAGGGLSNAQMSNLVLKADPPERILVADRGLREVTAGRFKATVRVQYGGPYQVVVTTGVGGTNYCQNIDVVGAKAPDEMPAARLVVTPAASATRAHATELRIRLEGERPDSVEPRQIVAASLTTGLTTLLDTFQHPGGWIVPAAELKPDIYVLTVYGQPEVAPTVLSLPAEHTP